jgi:uncharacterized delta-60 repeat protein
MPVLDTTFGNGGVVTTPVVGANGDRIYTAARQSDGKLILGGTTGTFDDFLGPYTGEALLMRVKTDGTIDPTFGTNGQLLLTISTRADEINAILVQPDQKILVVGSSYRINTQPSTFFSRILPNGTMDTTFGQNGIVSYPNLNVRDGSVAFAADGKIVVRGNDLMLGKLMARFLPDGMLDPAFGSGGQQFLFGFTIGISGPTIVLPDGKVLAATALGTGAATATRVFQLLADGTTDIAFGSTGETTLSMGPNDEAPTSLVFAADGSFFLGGRTTDVGFPDGVMMHLSGNGIVDASFAGGMGALRFTGQSTETIDEMVLDDVGRIVARGTIPNGNVVTPPGVTRVLPNGVIDTTFGTNGVAPSVAFGAALVRDALTGWFVAGTEFGVAGASDGAAIRLTSNGVVDTAFAPMGTARFNSGATRDLASHVIVQPDNKLLVAGMTVNNQRRVVLMRHNPNGSLDTTYGNAGIVRLDGINQSAGFARTADGGSVVAGYPSSAFKFGVARHDATGKLDMNFGTAGIASATPDPGGANAVPYALALDAAGNILVGGASGFSNVCTMGFVRFTPMGLLDSTFDGDGRVATILPMGGSCKVREINVLPGGKFLALGSRGNQFNSVVMRYLSNGSLDTSFGIGGIAEVTTPDFYHALDQMVRLSDGSLLIGGPAYGGAFIVVRMDSMGNVDPMYGVQGNAMITFGGAIASVTPYGLDWRGPEMVPMPDGSVFLAGAVVVNMQEQMLVMKLSPNGQLDTTFANAGRFVAPVKPGNFAAHDMAIQPDGKMVLAGRGHSSVSGSDMTLVRFDP